jgi:hypothetical protein
VKGRGGKGKWVSVRKREKWAEKKRVKKKRWKRQIQNVGGQIQDLLGFKEG